MEIHGKIRFLMTLGMSYDKLLLTISNSQLIYSNEVPIFLKAINHARFILGISGVYSFFVVGQFELRNFGQNEGEDDMVRKKYTEEQIIAVLKEAEAGGCPYPCCLWHQYVRGFP